MVLSKVHLTLVAIVAGGLLWIEHGNRISIGTPAAAEVAPSATSVCPDTDDVPFSAACIAFIDGGAMPDIHSRPLALAVSPEVQGRAELHAPACPPSNENAPYSAKCIKFLSGWYWQADPITNAP
jgi:hypothetical protein